MDEAAERRLLIVAGEASGDVHGARLVNALRARLAAPLRVRGVAGPALAAAGVEAVVDMHDLAVVGFSEVVARLPRVWRALRRVRAEAASFRPHAAVLVDSPGFNFRVGPALARAGVPVFYYVAPQVWAWHAERARAMSRWVSRLAVVFPFEEPLFRAAGVAATFVGHPLLDALEPEAAEAEFRRELGLEARGRILGLLPGSRRQELKAHVPVLLAAGARLARGRADVTPVLPMAPGHEPAELERLGLGRLRHGSGGGLELESAAGSARVVCGRTRCVQRWATACAVASGTATLETALFGTPLVVVYRTGFVNYHIARRVIRLERIGLPNIVAGAPVAPELLQDALTPERLAAEIAPWLDDPPARAAAAARLAVVRERLGVPGASARAAALLAELLA
jgi:lipid-A-disaccharide synthase